MTTQLVGFDLRPSACVFTWVATRVATRVATHVATHVAAQLAHRFFGMIHVAHGGITCNPFCL